jgi:NADPH2:quinone reductase
MARAIVLREHGAPDVLRSEPVDVGPPGPGEVRLKQTAIGVNYHDVYIRNGSYAAWMALPGIPGVEAAGVVVEAGPGTGFSPGERVAYLTPHYGAYASERLIEADRLVRLPDAVEDTVAAAAMVKGITAWLLLNRVYVVRPGDRILVHAAAGGVGRILCAWASHLGAEVIGTVGSPEKAVLARRSGCHHTILYREEDFVARVAALTDGRGVAVVYDSVGRDTFARSLACLAPLSHLVSFGQSSGPADALPMSALAGRSLTVSRPVVFHYTADRALLDEAAAALFGAVAAGTISIEVAGTFALDEAAAAHRVLEARGSTGSLLLLP